MKIMNLPDSSVLVIVVVVVKKKTADATVINLYQHTQANTVTVPSHRRIGVVSASVKEEQEKSEVLQPAETYSKETKKTNVVNQRTKK